MWTAAASWRTGTSRMPCAPSWTSSGSTSGDGSPKRNSMPSACSARANNSPPVTSVMGVSSPSRVPEAGRSRGRPGRVRSAPRSREPPFATDALDLLHALALERLVEPQQHTGRHSRASKAGPRAERQVERERLSERLVVDVDQREWHLWTAAPQLGGEFPADTARCAGDDRDLVVHARSPSWFRRA